MLLKIIIIILLLILSGSSIFAQSNKQPCYVLSRQQDSAKIFSRMEINPRFKGGRDAMLQAILPMLQLDSIMHDFDPSVRHWVDSVQVAFVVAKNGIMSDLTVSGSKNRVFSSEVFSALKGTSCSWISGSSAGRTLNGWYTALVIFTIDRRGARLGTLLTIRD